MSTAFWIYDVPVYFKPVNLFPVAFPAMVIVIPKCTESKQTWKLGEDTFATLGGVIHITQFFFFRFPTKKRSIWISDFMQTTFFYIGRFLKK